MFLFCTKPEEKSVHRQYIDLIQQTSGNWPNYQAPKDIRVSTPKRLVFVGPFDHSPRNRLVTLAPLTKCRGISLSKETYTPTQTLGIFQLTTLPLRVYGLIIVGLLRVKLVDWILGLMLERKSQILSLFLDTNLIGDIETRGVLKASSSRHGGNLTLSPPQYF